MNNEDDKLVKTIPMLITSAAGYSWKDNPIYSQIRRQEKYMALAWTITTLVRHSQQPEQLEDKH